MSKRLRIALMAFGLAVVLSLTALILWLFWPYLGSPGVGEQLSELKKQGKPVRARDLIPPKIPDSENAAILYQQAFKAVPLTKAELATVAEVVDSSGPQKPEKWKRVRQLVAKCKPALAIAERASRLPKCVFPVKWQDGPNARFDHLGKLRDLARLFAARASIEAQSSKIASAWQDVETGFAISQATSQEPALVSMLAQVALISTANDALQQCLAYGHIDEAHARRLYDKVGRFDIRARHIRALEGERAIMLTMSESLARGDFGQAFGSEESKTTKRPTSFVTRLVGRVNQWWVLKVMDEHIRNSRLSYREVVRRGIPDPGRNVPKYAILAAIFSPVFTHTIRARDRGMTKLSGTRIALALEAYYDRYGAYPETLNELRTKLGWAIEKDPFSGNDFVYKKLVRGYLLYSLGPNLKDDGGKPAGYFDKTGCGCAACGRPGTDHSRYPGDIVWRIER